MSYRVRPITSRVVLEFSHKALLLGTFLIFVLWGGTTTAQAQGVIRDTEIENALRVYMQPLLRAAGVPNERLQIILVNNPEINAAILPGRKIIVHSGLMIKSDSPLTVAGVLAHELGHYLNNDLVRLKGSFDKAEQDNLLGMALGVGLSVMTQNPAGLLSGGLLGSELGVRNRLSFSRSMEVGADRRAVRLMQKAGLGLQGLVNLTKQMLLDTPDPSLSDEEYLRSHPLMHDRLTFYEHHLNRSGEVKEKKGWPELHERARAKLRAFTLPPIQVRILYPMIRIDLPARIAQAIAAMRLAEYPFAISLIDELNQDYPEDGFLWDLAGDILQNSGDTDGAISRYSQAIDLLPWASLIRYQRASLLLKRHTPTADQQAQNDLRQALRFEPNIPSYWFNLSETYRRQSKEDEMQMALAEGNLRLGNVVKAKSHAKRAKKIAPKNSSVWFRADDILQQES